MTFDIDNYISPDNYSKLEGEKKQYVDRLLYSVEYGHFKMKSAFIKMAETDFKYAISNNNHYTEKIARADFAVQLLNLINELLDDETTVEDVAKEMSFRTFININRYFNVNNDSNSSYDKMFIKVSVEWFTSNYTNFNMSREYFLKIFN